MFVTTKRASAWLDQASNEVQGNEANDRRFQRPAGSVRARYAVRPLETPAGRCIALKLVSPVEGGKAEPRFFVLFESRYERIPRPRWLPLERVLSEAEAEQWVKEGFRG